MFLDIYILTYFSDEIFRFNLIFMQIFEQKLYTRINIQFKCTWLFMAFILLMENKLFITFFN